MTKGARFFSTRLVQKNYYQVQIAKNCLERTRVNFSSGIQISSKTKLSCNLGCLLIRDVKQNQNQKNQNQIDQKPKQFEHQNQIDQNQNKTTYSGFGFN